MSPPHRPPLANRLQRFNVIDHPPKLVVEGKIIRMVGMTLEAVGCNIPVGGRCLVVINEENNVEAEVVGFADKVTYLMAFDQLSGVNVGARVIPITHDLGIRVGRSMLGRVIGGTGEAIDGLGPLNGEDTIGLYSAPINPLDRQPVNSHLDMGVRAINTLMTVGRGQRIGLFAGSGVGKSVLLGMMTKYSTAEVVVVGLIGERGREVKEFIEHILGPEGRKKAIVIASPADDSPLKRLNGALLCTAIAEYFRDQGKDTLLLMDSLTRYAQAQREIGLAVGEPPATKGYPPSVFAKLPQLVERAGNSKSKKGSLTAIYTVLTEGDDQQDPIADAARAILDGHIVLSRRLAEEGHFPAVDIESSISRVMPQIVPEAHLANAVKIKQIYSRYQQNKDLILVGAYAKGSDPQIDFAIEQMPLLQGFLQQGMTEKSNWQQGVAAMEELLRAQDASNVATL
ncbi:MAG: flagellar protein export ATPase FliI [Gammaproteobacteria bacterium]|nr:flagellar protein export ATPase FliI [Gammaproteobacteria bacterium]